MDNPDDELKSGEAEAIKQILRDLVTRVYHIERTLGLEAAQQPPRPTAAEKSNAVTPPPVAPPIASPPSAESVRAGSVPSQPASPSPRPTEDWNPASAPTGSIESALLRY